MQLIDYMAQHGIDDEAFAALVGSRSKHAVKKWKYRERLPDAPEIVRIEDVTDGAVTVRDWAEAPVPRQIRKISEVAA